MTKEEFKQIRLELGRTQEELSEEIGLTPQMISYLENGHKPITARTEMAMLYLQGERK
jgi:transcriptional regulator with XRE-family HTH domain